LPPHFCENPPHVDAKSGNAAPGSMTKAASHSARAAANPASLTLEWLLNEMVRDELIPRAAAANLTVPPPQRKDGAKQHPLVIAAAQEWPDRRAQGAAADKVVAGMTTIDEVLALTPDPRDM